MKATVDSRALGRELAKISPIIKKNNVLPILNCVKLSFDSNILTITGSDLETTMMLKMSCECAKPFVVILEFASIKDICFKISEPITIDSSGKGVQISSSNAKFKFAKTNDEKHFPKTEDEEFALKIPADDEFFWALSGANSCKSDDSMKVTMNGVCIHVKPESITVVGTDAFVAYKKDFKIKTGKQAKVMVADQFVQLAKSLAVGDVYIGEKFIKVESPGMVIVSRLLDSNYCNYEMIMAKDIDYNFSSDRNSLINCLEVAGITSDPKTHSSVINFNGGDIKIVSQDIDYDREGESKVAATHNVDFKAICVNGSQMLRLLNLLDSEEVEMSFRSETATIFLRPAKEQNTLCLLQPLMINN